MGATRPVYATREDVKAALDVKFTARADRQIDRALAAGADTIDGDLHRRFWPQVATRSFDWPNHQYARPWRLWLDGNELISVTTLTAGGVEIPSGDYLLRRSDDLDVAPFDRIEIDLSSAAAFAAGDTHQQAIAVTGLFAGCPDDETDVGVLTDPLGVTGSAGFDIDPEVGVGSILRIDNERLIVTDKTMIDSGQDLAGPGLAALASDDTVPVSAGSAFDPRQVILLGSERMLVVDVAGNDLTVKRAWDGTTLAAHSAGADVFALTGLIVDRGQLGTTPAAHADGATVFRFDPPPLIRSLNVAEAINVLQQDQAAWGRTVGSGESEREAGGVGLTALRAQAMTAHGRQARIGAI